PRSSWRLARARAVRSQGEGEHPSERTPVRERGSGADNAASGPHQRGLLGFFDAFDRNGSISAGDLRADARFDLGGDRRVVLEELLGGLATLAEAGLREGEPGARLV